MSTENAPVAASAMPSLAEVAAQFAGKPILNAQLTRDAAVVKTAATEAPRVPENARDSAITTPEAAVEDVPSENADPAEAAPEAPVEEKKDPVSSRFAALSKREKELRNREQQGNATLRAAEVRVKEMEARLAKELEDTQAQRKALLEGKRPLDVLKAAGFGYADATQDAIGGYKPKEPDPLDERLKPVHERLGKIDELDTRLSKWEQELTSREQQSNLTTVNNSIKNTIASSADTYEYLDKFGEQAVDLVRDVLINYYETHGQPLTYGEACDQVEAYYEEEVAAKLLSTKKIQARLQPQAPAPTATKTDKKPAPSASPKTLTSDLAASGQPAVDIDKMSKREALALLSKQLKFV